MSESRRTKDLIAAHGLIDQRRKWCQGVAMKMRSAWGVRYEAYCSLGAISAVTLYPAATDDETTGRFYDCILALTRAMGFECSRESSRENVWNYNDTHRHKEVMALWEKAIADSQREDRIAEVVEALAAGVAEPDAAESCAAMAVE